MHESKRGEGIMRGWWSDARHFQIAALSALLVVNFVWFDFGAKPGYSALAICSALATQVVCSRYFELPQIDHDEPRARAGQLIELGLELWPRGQIEFAGDGDDGRLLVLADLYPKLVLHAGHEPTDLTRAM